MPSSDQNSAGGATPVWFGGCTPYNTAANTAGHQVKTGSGVFYGFNVNTAGATSTATAYDGTSTSGTKLGTFSTTAIGPTGIPLGLQFTLGLFIVLTGGTPADVTVGYR